MYRCPVCGYDRLRKPAKEFAICPSCGTEFGYSDSGPDPISEIHEHLRANWIKNGAKWQSSVVSSPPYWNPWEQMLKAHLALSLPDIERAKMTEILNIVNSDFGFREPNKSFVFRAPNGNFVGELTIA